MAIQTKYDPRQDRMLLALDFKEGERRSLWVTRRQWLGMLHEIAAMKVAPLDDGGALPPHTKASQPLKPQADAVTVDTVRVRKRPEGGAKVVFALDEEAVALVLPGDALANFQRLLEQQSERAGWDPRAAMERLDAGVVASRAMRKAKGES